MKPKYFELTLQGKDGDTFKTHVWAVTLQIAKDCIALTEPEYKVSSWRIADCGCDNEARCSFHTAVA